MSKGKPTEVLSHSSLGKLPARNVLDCIYALSPDGTYLHHHREEVDKTEDASGIVYTLNGEPPAAGRERCQIIPPMVNEFDTFESVA